MNIESGIRFILFLLIFGYGNYLIMLLRYEHEFKKRKIIQQNKILKLYPQDTFINFLE